MSQQEAEEPSDMNRRVALVTGANHGIGAAIARALAAQGMAVALTYLREPILGETTGVPLIVDAPDERPSAADRVVDAIGAAGGTAKAREAVD